MFIAYIVVTLLAAAANTFSATLDFIRYKQILVNMAKVGVSESWLTQHSAFSRPRERLDYWLAFASDSSE
jgi:hypothetical protein